MTGDELVVLEAVVAPLSSRLLKLSIDNNKSVDISTTYSSPSKPQAESTIDGPLAGEYVHSVQIL